MSLDFRYSASSIPNMYTNLILLLFLIFSLVLYLTYICLPNVIHKKMYVHVWVLRCVNVYECLQCELGSMDSLTEMWISVISMEFFNYRVKNHVEKPSIKINIIYKLELYSLSLFNV